MAYRTPPSRLGGAGFKLDFTPLVKAMLTLYGGVWLFLVVVTNWLPSSWSRINIPQGEFNDPTRFDLFSVLALWPPGGASPASPGFHLWQLITAHFVHPTAGVFTVVLNLLMIVFFAGPVEGFLGRQRFLKVWGAAAIGGAIGAVLFGLVQGTGTPASGVGPGILALIVVFCAMMPEATIQLFFILPIKAKYVGWGTAGLVVLTALANPAAAGGWEVGGMGLGYAAWRWGDDLTPRRIRLKLKARRIQKKISKFEVIDGGGGDDDSSVYH